MKTSPLTSSLRFSSSLLWPLLGCAVFEPLEDVRQPATAGAGGAGAPAPDAAAGAPPAPPEPAARAMDAGASESMNACALAAPLACATPAAGAALVDSFEGHPRNFRGNYPPASPDGFGATARWFRVGTRAATPGQAGTWDLVPVESDAGPGSGVALRVTLARNTSPGVNTFGVNLNHPLGADRAACLDLTGFAGVRFSFRASRPSLRVYFSASEQRDPTPSCCDCFDFAVAVDPADPTQLGRPLPADGWSVISVRFDELRPGTMLGQSAAPQLDQVVSFRFGVVETDAASNAHPREDTDVWLDDIELLPAGAL